MALYLIKDAERTSPELEGGLAIHGEMLHEWIYQTFRSWILKADTKEIVGDVKTLHLNKRYNPEEYIENFKKEVMEGAK